MTEKEQKSRDQLLGMDRPITRRDFLNGVAIGTAVAASGPLFAGALTDSAPPASMPSAAQDAFGYYPPLLNGMRGSHPGSFEDAHALRDGHTWPAATDTGEEYDLIVVGGGISGLAAAHFYRAKAPKSRILILDNHDDFGGHAKRNEFNLNGQLHLMNGGTLEIDSPRPYGPVAAGLLKTLGLDVPALIKSTQHLKFYKQRGLRPATFFDQETFGADKLIAGPGPMSTTTPSPWRKLCARHPCRISPASKSCKSKRRKSITCRASHPPQRKIACRA
jgi:spermidine dehydrogenase